jgi:hypothetical protein
VARISEDTSIARKKVRKRKGVETCEWSAFLWFISLEAALKELFSLQLRLSDASTLAEAAVDAKRILASLCEALQPTFEVIPKGAKG